jgi:HlyD family secretion protein
MKALRSVLRNRRVLAAVGLVVALILVVAWPEAVAVDVAPVERGPLQVTVDEEGETRVRDRFMVSSPVAGRVQRIELEPGDKVSHGAVVALVVPAPLDARAQAEAEAAARAAASAVGRVRAERQRAEAAARLARSELQRLRALSEQRIVSEQALEAQDTAVRSADDALQAAEFAVATASYQMEQARARLAGGSSGRPLEVRAPVDGVVLKRLRESESVVPPGDPLLELGDPRNLEIVSDLLSTDAVKVRAGQAVWIEQWGGEEALRGRVRRVEPSGFMKISALGVEEQRVNVVIDFDGPPEARPSLGDSYRVEVRIVVWETADAVQVPGSALFRRGEKWAVFVANGGRAHLREIEVGRRNGLTAQVLKGLEAGARVVAHPPDTLADGMRVKARE